MNKLVITGEAAKGTPPSWQAGHMQPLGGMEDQCRVVITMHDLMGLEFSL